MMNWILIIAIVAIGIIVGMIISHFLPKIKSVWLISICILALIGGLWCGHLLTITTSIIISICIMLLGVIIFPGIIIIYTRLSKKFCGRCGGWIFMGLLLFYFNYVCIPAALFLLALWGMHLQGFIKFSLTN